MGPYAAFLSGEKDKFAIVVNHIICENTCLLDMVGPLAHLLWRCADNPKVSGAILSCKGKMPESRIEPADTHSVNTPSSRSKLELWLKNIQKQQ